jgi:hypothetical protein
MVLPSVWFLFLSSGLVFVAGCNPCDRSGCEVRDNPAKDSGHSAIAGTVSTETDVVVNGCQECPFGSATLSVWKTATATMDSATAKAIVDGSAATVVVQANQRYLQALDPGTYLVCIRPSCVSLDVTAGHVTTLNVEQVYGPGELLVAEPGERTTHSANRLDIGF